MRLLPEIIGINLSEEEIRIPSKNGYVFDRNNTNRRGLSRFLEMSMPRKGGKIAIVEVPNWRFDILHPIDIIEDIIIGHGYENLLHRNQPHP